MKSKKKIKMIKLLHHPMKWVKSSNKEICSECKVPYPCKTITTISKKHLKEI